MVIGTGDVSTQVSKAMISKGAFPMIVSSCHHERAEAMAKELGGEAVVYENFDARAAESDILIASTLAPHALITQKQVKNWMRMRHEKPLFLIDIAVPRNIEATVENIDNVYLYNIDDLKDIADKNMNDRQGQLDQCFNIIQGQTHHFMNWLFKEFGRQVLS